MRAVLLVAVLVVLPSVARADDEIAHGVVVKVEHEEIYVNLGTERGLADGAALRIKRTIKLRHPVTHAAIEDWIPIGSATVTQAGSVLSRAVVGKLAQEVHVGDLAEVLIERPDGRPDGRPDAAHGPKEPPSKPKPVEAVPRDPVVAEVMDLFVAQTGQPIEARIAGWERYLSTHTSSPFAESIRHELDALHALDDQLEPPSATRNTETITTAKHAAPASAAMGSQIPLVFVLDHPERVASAYLHYRPRDARVYRRLLLVREHDLYLRGAVPAEVVRPPGVDYFVEVSSITGSSGPAVGSPSEPIRVDVDAPSVLDRFGPEPGRSSVKLSADYLDFATFDQRGGDRTDQVTTANVDFTYRLDSLIESIGVGYGVFLGAGGYANRAWSDADPLRRSGFHYGYTDLEAGGVVNRIHLSFGAKGIAGVGRDGFGLGVEGRVRIGDRDATNLVLAASTVAQVGYLSEIRFGTRPARDFLVGLSVGATNQPTQGDVAVKLGTELEWIGFSNVSLILRGSWQGRTTEHGGIGGGGGLGVYW